MHTLSDGTVVREPGDLWEWPTKKLCALYNELTGEQVKRFSSRTVAVDRTWKALARHGAPANQEARAPKHRVLTFEHEAAETQKPPREGSKRHVVLKLLEAGTTVEEVMVEIDSTRRYAIEHIRLLAKVHGYGLTQDEDGRVRCFPSDG